MVSDGITNLVILSTGVKGEAVYITTEGTKMLLLFKASGKRFKPELCVLLYLLY